MMVIMVVIVTVVEMESKGIQKVYFYGATQK